MKKLIILFGVLVIAMAYRDVIPSKESNKVVLDWMKLQQRLIRNTNGVPHIVFSRHFAYTSVAVYEAVSVGSKEHKMLQEKLDGLGGIPEAPQGPISREASANATFGEMFRFFYGKEEKNLELIDSLESQYSLKLENSANPREIQNSIAFGKSVAKAVIEWSNGDGERNEQKPYQILSGEGLWSKTPPGFSNPAVPYWSERRSMVKGIDRSFSIKPTFGFSSDKNSSFYKDVKEVFEVSRNLSEEQRQIALFWDDSPGKYLSVFGHWNSIFAQLAESKNLDLLTTAEAMVKLSVSQYEAGIACWREKYHHNLLRPVTYIRKYFDPNWSPLIETPPHPEFPAAHATLSFAAAVALEDAFGPSVTFKDSTYADIGMPERSFRSLKLAAEEAGMSRLYGGIHYRSSINAGAELGVRTSTAVLSNLKFD